MKKIAWLLIFVLLFQYVPLNVQADTTAETVNAESVTAAEVYHEMKTRETGERVYPIVIKVKAPITPYYPEIKSFTIDGIAKNNVNLEKPEGFQSAEMVLSCAIPVSDLAEGKDHKISATIGFQISRGNTMVDGTMDITHSFKVQTIQKYYEVTDLSPIYISSKESYHMFIDDRTFYTENNNVKVEAIDLLDQSGVVKSSVNYVSDSGDISNTEDSRYSDETLGKAVSKLGKYCFTYNTRSDFDLKNPLSEGFYNIRYKLDDGTVYVIKNAVKSTASPVIYSVADTADEGFHTSYNLGRISTDQSGKYVSICVYGLNITKDTVKPVFYDGETAITGSVVAEEHASMGSYFRLEKKTSSAWTDGWDIKYVDDDCVRRTFDITFFSADGRELTNEEDVGKIVPTSVEIIKRDIYYRYYDSVRKTFTIYFSSDSNVDTSVKPTVSFCDYNDNKYGKDSYTAEKIISETNKFTRQSETKAIFSVEDIDGGVFKYGNPYFEVTYKKKDGTEENYKLENDDDIQEICGTYCSSETEEVDHVKGGRDVVLYYPYWIGSVYQFSDTGTGSNHYITAEEASYLGTERFTYCDYEKGTGNRGNINKHDRFWQLGFFIEGKEPENTPTTPGGNNGIGTDPTEKDDSSDGENSGKPQNPTQPDKNDGENSGKPQNPAQPDKNNGGNGNVAKPHVHDYKYTSNNDATVLADGTKTGVCSCGDKVTESDVGSKLAAILKVPAVSFSMKKGQTYKGFAVTMEKGDSIISVKSNKTNLVKVTSLNKTKGTFTLKAQKKTGTAKVSITLASGLKKTLTIKVQAGTVKTSKITGLKSKVSIKKGKSLTLKPELTPITSTQKITYKTSNKKIATVTSKGVIKAKKKGKAKITVKSGSKKKVVTVTVK